MHSRYQVSSVKEPRKCYGRFLQGTVVVPKERRDMKRVVVDHYGGPEVLRVVEEDDPRPGPGEVCVRVLAAGVSFTDALLRAGTYLGGPKPPFTPGYELVGVVEQLGPGCSRLRVGDRVAALTVWGADAERVCVPEKYAVEVPEDLDPAEVVSLVLPYVTAYQLLHRVARVKGGETVLVHGAAGRVGTAVLELGALAGLRLYGTASARDLAAGSAVTGSTSCATATRSGSGRTSSSCSSCSGVARSTRPWPSACRSSKSAARTNCWRARRPRESSYSCHNPGPHAGISRRRA